MTSTGASTRPEVPYGAWPSPLGLDALTARTVTLGEPRLDATSTWWVERRPENGGLATLVRCPDGGIPGDVNLVLPGGDTLDARTRVYEYGGGAYDVADGTVVACHGPTSRLYRAEVDEDAAPSAGAADVPAGLRYPPEPGPLTASARPLTPAGGARYAAPLIDHRRGLVHAVREDHDNPDAAGQPTVDLVAVPLDGSAADDGSAVRTVLAGWDFVASPALSPDGRLMACVAWNHPAMPWTSSELIVVDVDAALAASGTGDDPGTSADSATPTVRRVAGGDGVAVQSPVWGPDGDLVFLDDSSGYTNPYRAERQGQDLRVRALHRSGVDLGLPQWGTGTRVAAMLDEDHLVAVVTEDGRRRLMALRRLSGEAEEWQSGWAPVGGLDARDGRVVLVAAGETEGPAIVRLDLASATSHVLRRGGPTVLEPADISRPEPLSWPVTVPTGDGAAAGEPETAFGFFYAPTNSAVTAPEGELPPVLVMVHGGPTAATSPTYTTGIQFWTTRGIAVLDVNYGGSTGYGRAYQDRLDGRWGLVDVADCAAGVRHLVDTGRVDGARVGIRGGSAGGFTTLAALTSTDVFTAGASYYGVTDLEALATDTHKFESRYLDGLVAPYPDGRAVYRDRSPIDHLDRLSAPVVILQGSDDAVVPKNQATMLADALRAKGLPVALRVYDGEGHGFRKAENIQDSAAAELSFYGQVWGFTPAGDIPVLPVENL